jgi:uncharacterized protein YceH (UPF0502 family)
VLPELNEKEVRVIGCLIEKSVVTPDQYPLTLNALTNACNQKSSRSPVMNLTQGEVQHTIRDLEAKHLVRTDENFKSRTEKYTQRFCNTRYSDFHFDDAQLAIVCLLLLRGPQTPGELRSRSGRLHTFADNSGVVSALTSLIGTCFPGLSMSKPMRATLLPSGLRRAAPASRILPNVSAGSKRSSHPSSNSSVSRTTDTP